MTAVEPHHETERALGLELGGKERLIWCGRPRPRLRLRLDELVLLLFFVAWTGGAVSMQALVIVKGAPWFVVLWPAPFVMIGLYLVSSRLMAIQHRAVTFYALTNARIVIVSPSFKTRALSIPLRDIPDVTISQNRDGSGNIGFGPHALTLPASRWSWSRRPERVIPCLDSIENAREVFERIQEAWRAQTQPAARLKDRRPDRSSSS